MLRASVALRGLPFLAALIVAGACSSHDSPAVAAKPSTTTSSTRRAPVESGSPWPTAMHDVTHSGRSAFAGPTTGHVRWTRKLEGNVTPGPVVGADGTIYLATNAGTLHALAPDTGRDSWTLRGPGSSGTDLSSSPTVLPSGVIVWSTAGSTIVGVSPEGKQLWSVDLPSSGTSPMPHGDRVYVMSTDGSLTALALQDGGRSAVLQWSLPLGSGSYASVAIADDGLIATNVGSEVIAVRDEGARGTVAWRQELGALSEISPAIGPGGTVVSGGNNAFIQYFASDGKPLGKFDRETESYSSPVVTDGLVVQGNHRAAVVVVDLASGERKLLVRRRVTARGRTAGIWTSPALDRDKNIYFGTRSGHIVGFAWSGKLLFDINAGTDATIDSYPALTGDGALIVGDTNGVVRAIAD